jgi:hypothetical protein
LRAVTFLRLAALAALVLALALAAAPARAQLGNPFDNLPPAATPTPTPPPADANADDETGRNTLYAIGGVLLVAFAVIGTWIARDARRSLPKELQEEHRRDEGPHRHERQAKARARAKARKARAARKRTRRARR